MPLVQPTRAYLRASIHVKSQRLTYAPTRSRRLNEVCGLFVLALAALLILSLMSYNPADPSFNTVGGETADAAHLSRNWTGLTGAYFADLVLQFLGVAALLVPVAVGRVGVSWMRSRPVGAGAVKTIGLLLWLAFAPAGIALLPGHTLWRGALPLSGVEGRLLADFLVHLLNAPGAAILTGCVVALSLYLATSFALGSAPGWFTGQFASFRSSREQLSHWRLRKAHPAELGSPPAAHTEIDSDGRPDADFAEKHSLLSGFLRLFRRKHSAPTGIGTEADGLDSSEPVSLWDTMPRTDVDAPHLEGLAAASAAAAPFAAQLAMAAIPLHSGDVASDPHTLEGQPHTPRVAVPLREEDDWLNAPERQTITPILSQQSEGRPSRPPLALDSAPLGAGLRLVHRGSTPPLSGSTLYPTPSPVADSVPAAEPPVASVPLAPAMNERTAQPARRPMAPPQSPAPTPSPMADLRDQNIAFGARSDAHQLKGFQPVKSIRGYKLPPSSLLHASEGQSVVREEVLRAEAQVLVEKCAEFGVAGRVEQINPGPVVTTYEFRPDAGVKYSRVTGLADDLCLAMAAESVLIERMAGKSTVGIQVPNTERETIWLRDVVESEPFASTKSKLPIALGKDIDGHIITADLAGMPHVLIAGSTGSGKSVAINAMIMSVLFRSTPEQVRMILVDPKRVELGMYEGIPHLFTPIITEAKLAANALKNAVKEMERRLKLLAANHVRNIDQFNKLFEHGSEYLFEDVNQEPLPYIIIVIDELADLMMLDRANVEEAITRLAQMARAVGIHLVLATQRPSVDVITGLIKANVPTRMSFRLATKIDSRTIIDMNGAESLLGRGDMLFLPPGTSRLQRVHAPFVTEKEIAAVTAFWKAQGQAEYVEGFLDGPKDEKGESGSGSSNDGEEADPMFDDAVRLVFEFGKASTSLLQRRLRIGYGRAAHLIDLMERDGLVGPADGSKPRELLKPASYFAEVDAANR